MARPGIKVVANFDQALTADKVAYNRYGKHFGFYISPKGTTVANQVGTETGNIDSAQLKADIEAMQGTSIVNNPKWEDVRTDDGANGDTVDGDGVNNSPNTPATGIGTSGVPAVIGKYNWVDAGQLYAVTVVADLDA